MKASINIWNPTTGNEQVTLRELKNRINNRRKVALNPGNLKSKQITVMCCNENSTQVAAHYKSFEINMFNADKAIKVYNQGGCQVASLIKK